MRLRRPREQRGNASQLHLRDASRTGDKDHIGGVGGEQAVADDAGDVVDFPLQRQRVFDLQAVDIENDVAVVRDEALPPLRSAAQSDQRPGRQAAGHGNDLHRQRECAQGGRQLGLINDANKLIRGGGDDFFPGQGAAAALDQAAAGIYFVRAIDIDHRRRRRVQVQDRNAPPPEPLGAGFAARHGGVKLVANRRQGVNEAVGRAAGADADYGFPR